MNQEIHQKSVLNFLLS